MEPSSTGQPRRRQHNDISSIPACLAGNDVLAGTMAVARSTDFMRAPKSATATVNIDPPASSYAIMRRAGPYRGENSGPGKDIKGELDTPPGIREQNLPEADIGRIRSINSSARTGNEGGLATPSAVCGSSCKKSGRPVDQPIGRHCADRVGRDYVETTNRSLDQIALDAKRHCLAQQPSHR